MSVNFNASVNFSSYNSTFSSLNQLSLGGGASISTASFSAISDGFALAGGNISFSQAFSALPPAPLPRPPAFGATLGQAAASFGNFMSSVGGFGVEGSFGFGQFTQLSAMNSVVGNFMSTQALYGQSSVSSLNIHAEASFTTPAAMKRTLKDEFAAGNSAGKGKKSNLSNSPETVLALNNILKGHSDNMKLPELQKKLKEQYGIESDITKIDGRKALKFKNGDTFVDASGNGAMGTKDYKFAGAVADIKKKYGLSDADMKNFGTAEGKKALGAMSNARTQLQLPQTHKMSFDYQQTTVQNNWFGMQNSFLDMQQFEPIFAQAFQLAF